MIMIPWLSNQLWKCFSKRMFFSVTSKWKLMECRQYTETNNLSPCWSSQFSSLCCGGSRWLPGQQAGLGPSPSASGRSQWRLTGRLATTLLPQSLMFTVYSSCSSYAWLFRQQSIFRAYSRVMMGALGLKSYLYIPPWKLNIIFTLKYFFYTLEFLRATTWPLNSVLPFIAETPCSPLKGVRAAQRFGSLRQDWRSGPKPRS